MPEENKSKAISVWTSAPGTHGRLPAPDLQDILTRRGEHVYGGYGEGLSPSPVFS